MGKMKYGVDRRVGCIAVIRKDITPPSCGLHSDDPHVVKFWHGRNLAGRIYGITSRVYWHVPGYMVKRAYRIANELNNEKERRDKYFSEA